jgi:hypothetical protein
MRCKVKPMQFGRGVQQHRPKTNQRPIGLALHVFCFVAAEFAAAERLLEVSVKQFDSPSTPIQFRNVPIVQSCRVYHSEAATHRDSVYLRNSQPAFSRIQRTTRRMMAETSPESVRPRYA